MKKRRLALVLPGHNEEIIIAKTIQSALQAGMKRRDIYVVDDASSDSTREIALGLLSERNILSVDRSGKARAVYKALLHFEIESKYDWVHIADADSIFCLNYFKIYRRHLNDQWVAAVGFVQSMPGNWLSVYRSFSYTYGQHIFRRIQSWFGIIAVLPGPVTCFKTSILGRLDFMSDSVTEDFDLTLQIHRKKLGRIRFIPEAINYTQDPRTLGDFISQTLRWQRGFFQGLRKYRICFRLRKIDAGIGYQMSETIYYFLQALVLLPLIILSSHSINGPLTILGADFLAISLLACFSAWVAKRPVILLSLTYFYFLRFLELAIFLYAFFEVIVFRQFRTTGHGWQTEGRRYEVTMKNVGDV